MRKMAKPFIYFVERFYPDPFVFVIILTAVVFLGVFGLTDAGPVAAVAAWGGGLAGLLEFIAQISITLVAAHALAHTDAVRRGLERLGAMPRSPMVAYGMVAFIAGVASLFAWAFGLVVGALIARQVAIQAKRRGLQLHYPLLVAAAYAGFVVWHMGYSSSAALFVATPGHALEEQVGGTIPVTDTIFAGWNVATALVTLVVVSILMAAMRPRDEEILEIPQRAIDDYQETLRRLDHELGDGGPPPGGGDGDRASPQQVKQGTAASGVESPERPAAAKTETRTETVPGATTTLAQRLDQSRGLSLAFGLAILIYLVYWFSTEGLNLDLNVVNWSFLCLGLLLARSPLHYVKLIGNASVTVGQIILQYPFYAGIMGLMIDTGLVSVIAGWFIAISSAATLGFSAFVSGGLINMFIPSGGGQWAVQGPIFIEAAQALGTDPSRIVMGVAYGDQWTNMIQPFWTIPLLAIAGLHMRQIMGYTFVVFFVTFFLFGGGLLLAGAG
ncbi:MAG: short-chain fatty acid transporter [Egibacteraceae bacterium]